MKYTIFLIVLTGMLTTAIAQTNALSQQTLDQLKSEQIKMFDMFCNGDVETFKVLAGDDYLTINADGTYMNKSETFDLIPKFKGSTYNLIEQKDRVYGNLVISTGRAKFYFGSFLAADVYFNQSWIYRDGRWQFINWQGTMTGTPGYYPILMTLTLAFLFFGLVFWVYRVRLRKARYIAH